MIATRSRFTDITIRTTQFVVPVFRRDYGWRATKWQLAWSNDHFGKNLLACSASSAW